MDTLVWITLYIKLWNTQTNNYLSTLSFFEADICILVAHNTYNCDNRQTCVDHKCNIPDMQDHKCNILERIEHIVELHKIFILYLAQM